MLTLPVRRRPRGRGAPPLRTVQLNISIGWRRELHSWVILIGSLLVFGDQVFDGILLAQSPRTRIGEAGAILGLTIAAFVAALLRAWTLPKAVAAFQDSEESSPAPASAMPAAETAQLFPAPDLAREPLGAATPALVVETAEQR